MALKMPFRRASMDTDSPWSSMRSKDFGLFRKFSSGIIVKSKCLYEVWNCWNLKSRNIHGRASTWSNDKQLIPRALDFGSAVEVKPQGETITPLSTSVSEHFFAKASI